ncbi:MAG: marine proteobacterial sortase target protein, partial [Gammaproteobacteria bacterium]
DVEMWPQKITDLYRGEPLVITSRSQQLPAKLKISGRIGSQPWASEIALSGGQDRPGISILWARKKIAALMQAKRDTEFDSIKQTIITTALEHHLVSKYTSLVAVDVTPVRPADKSMDSHAVPTHLPEGWDYNKVFGQAYPATATDARSQFLFGLILMLLSLYFLITQRRTTGTH